MKAFTVDAEWAPQKNYQVSQLESERKRANCGSMVWKNPSFTMQDLPVPDIDDDDLLVRVKRCGICGSDSHLYETDENNYIIFSGPVKLPCIIGHEYSGIIEKVGSKVKNFKVGDYVAAESIVWCGMCTPCRSGAFNQCENVELAGITVDGALAEFVRVNQRQCWSLNSLQESFSEDDLFDIGALIEPLGCAYNGMFISAGGFKPGATVVVYGAGPIGLGAVAFARIAGASQILVFDPIADRLNIAKQLGADYVFDTNQLAKAGSRPRDFVMEFTQGKGAEMQVEAAGAAPATVPEMEESLAFNGKIVYLGRAATYTPIMLNNLVSGANTIVGARGHAGYGIYANIIKLLASKRLQVAEIVTSSYGFDDTFDALKKSVQRTDAKILVRIP